MYGVPVDARGSPPWVSALQHVLLISFAECRRNMKNTGRARSVARSVLIWAATDTAASVLC